MILLSAFIVFSIFFTNVALGAFADSAFLGDIGEMLVLSVASVLFVIAIIRKEAERSNKDGSKKVSRED